MDFKDLQKEWNHEKNQAMYIFDEEALMRTVAQRARAVERTAAINEWGLIIVAVITCILLLVIGSDGLYKVLAAMTMLATGGYVWWRRQQRLREQANIERTVLSDIEQAVANARYLVRFAQTFAYWFLLPTAAVTLFRMSQKAIDPWKWAGIIVCFIVSYLLVQLELRWKHLPRLRRLEELRDKLKE